MHLLALLVAASATTSVPWHVPTAMKRSLVEWVDGAKAANRDRHCYRLTLGAAPLEGSATADMLRVLEPRGALEACLDAAEDVGALVLDHDASTRKATHKDFVHPVRAAEGISASKRARRLRPACATLIEAVERAVRHQDACSPYLTGVRENALSGDRVYRIGYLVILEALHHAEEGQVGRAFDQLRDTIRWGQDIGRNAQMHAALPGSIIGLVAGLALESVLNHATPSEAELWRLDATLIHLLSTQIDFHHLIQREHEFYAIDELAPVLAPVWKVQDAPPARPQAGRRVQPDETIEQHWTLLLAHRLMARAMQEACPPGATAGACLEAARRLSARHEEAKDTRMLAAAWASLYKEEEYRTQAAGVLLAQVRAYFHKESHRHRAMLNHASLPLAAARLHVGVKLFQIRHGRCPTLDDLDTWPLSTMRDDHFFGGQLRVVAADFGLRVGPSRPVLRDGEVGPLLYHIHCPPQ